jgi:hypothetical protein
MDSLIDEAWKDFEQLDQVKVPRQITIPCERCDYATDGKCSFDYPEAFTSEAHDCSMFTE